ncbi:TPA: hypothetical protein ACNFRY_006193 [Pseudomonas aeruginosa]|uniref:hypothetical protein n=1 Tax=Pseudomonas aeruginosa TaxID=287 RepID=UPI000EAD477C|nr:hypothetical protein [Pseudomonas aeruginosa]MBG4276629.1 hypothetical protein [Pseudomonas aeruginosa]MCO1670244.1 hypothetical protein [Pseudomonas aeruginosa]MCO1769251.1 hypothetical protein [Pseudomonas aeruginosa]QYE75766.1 hypothetical protein KZ795_21105 [Pseudomonas aeruginosa]HBO2189938.1 hypothetical protein [Pseudomonas aeruginosa]
MDAQELLDALRKKLGTRYLGELAEALGVSLQTLANWKNSDKKLSVEQIAGAIAKSRQAAVKTSQYETIRPVVEFYGIERYRSRDDRKWQLFQANTLYAQGLKDKLLDAHGIYIFYDSRGHSIYVGKAREQSLWKEMNLAFNRPRAIQKIVLVPHPKRNQAFSPGHEKLRQPKDTQLELCDLAYFFSAYQVVDGMINDLEALMVRGFANDLLNVKMETFAHSRR